jgi:hypothetical protein
MSLCMMGKTYRKHVAKQWMYNVSVQTTCLTLVVTCAVCSLSTNGCPNHRSRYDLSVLVSDRSHFIWDWISKLQFLSKNGSLYKNTHSNIHLNLRHKINRYIYTYIYKYMCVCVCIYIYFRHGLIDGSLIFHVFPTRVWNTAERL